MNEYQHLKSSPKELIVIYKSHIFALGLKDSFFVGEKITLHQE